MGGDRPNVMVGHNERGARDNVWNDVKYFKLLSIKYLIPAGRYRQLDGAEMRFSWGRNNGVI